MSEINELLTSIGLTDKELNVYETVIAFGFRTAGQISSKTKIPHSEVKSIADELVEKNYLKKIQMQSDEAAIYIPIAPKISISSDLSKKLSDKLKDLSSRVSEIWLETQKSMDEETGELIEVAQSLILGYSEHLDNLVESGEDSITKWSSSTQKSLEETITEEFEKFKTIVLNPLTSVAEELDSLSQKARQEAVSNAETINSKTESHQQSIEEAVESIKTELEEFIDYVDLIVNGRVTGTNELLEKLSDKSIDQSKKFIQTSRQKIDEIREIETKNAQKINEEFIDKSITGHSKASEDLLSHSQDFKENFNELIELGIKGIDDQKNSLVTQSQSVINDLNENQINYVNQLQEDFTSSVDLIQNEAVNELSIILKNSSDKLTGLKNEIDTNLNSHQKDISGQLEDLTTNINNVLDQKFSEMIELLTSFTDDIKVSTKSNVDDTNNSLIDLKNFLKSFLLNIEQELSDHFATLTSSVEEGMSETINESTSKIGENLSSNKSAISEMNQDIIAKLNDFQSLIESFLHKSKDDLSGQLENSQEKFDESINESLQAYHTESERISEMQTEQMKQIAKEAEELTDEAEKITDDLTNLVNSKLQETKNQSLANLEEAVNLDIEKMYKELSRFNDRLERELTRFYENFVTQSHGLRDDVPQRIETMFIDQADRLENFRREFERNKRFISDFIKTIIQDMEPGARSWKRKEFQTEFFEKAQRMNVDFERFDNQISEHFRATIDDTDEIKNDLLADFNRIIQDELNRLDELVNSQGEEANNITKNFLDSIDSHKKTMQRDMSTHINDTIEELSSTIRTDLLTKLDQPLDSLLGKAQAIATGTEGVEQENRIIKAQNLLIEKIDNSIEELTNSLKSAFEDSIKTLETGVETSVSESQQLVKTTENNLNKSFNKQTSTLEKSIETMNNKLEGLKMGVLDDLNSSIENTKSKLSSTLETKSEEIEESVVNNTSKIEETTQTRIDEIDSTLDQFTTNLNSIKTETSSDASTKITASIKNQKESTQTTLKKLNTSTKSTQDDLLQAQTALKEKISTQLETTKVEMSEISTDYLGNMEMAKDEISENINKYFEEVSPESSLEELIQNNEENFNTFKSELEELHEQLTDDLKSRITKLRESSQQNLDKLFTNFSDTLNEIEENNSNFNLDVFDQVSTQLSEFQREILEAIESTKENIDNVVINSIETVRSDVLDPANSVIAAIREVSINFKERIDMISATLRQIESDEDNNIVKAENMLLQNINSEIGEEKENWIKRSSTIYEDQKKSLKEQSKQFKDTILKSSSKGKDDITEEINKIPNVVDETLDAASKSMELLNEISKGTVNLDPDITDTSYLDVTREAIEHNLNGLLQRTKSSITIVSPTLSWLDPELIPTFKRASVRIVIDPDKVGTEDEKIIQRFKDEDVNVSLRRLDRNRYRRDVNMIMASRDKEEVMLSKLLDTDKPYAFVSQDIYFIEKFAELFGIFQTMPEYNI